jgi:hypothetical protein
MTYSVTNNTEAALAEAFAEKFAQDIKYVSAVKKWFLNSWGQVPRWDPDERQQVLYHVLETCMEAATRSGDPTLARTLCSASFIAAVERLARCHPDLAATKADVGIIPKKRKQEVSVG